MRCVVKAATQRHPQSRHSGLLLRNRQWVWGFTLFETVIVMGIFLIVFSFGLFIGFDYYKSYLLAAERDTVVAMLRKARSQALNNVLQAAHGFYVATTSYIIFTGSSYATRNALYDEVINRLPGVNASGTTEVVFWPLAATSTASGTIALSDEVRQVGVHVNYEGRINW